MSILVLPHGVAPQLGDFSSLSLSAHLPVKACPQLVQLLLHMAAVALREGVFLCAQENSVPDKDRIPTNIHKAQWAQLETAAGPPQLGLPPELPGAAIAGLNSSHATSYKTAHRHAAWHCTDTTQRDAYSMCTSPVVPFSTPIALEFAHPSNKQCHCHTHLLHLPQCQYCWRAGP
jgi:hypothetical protein